HAVHFGYSGSVGPQKWGSLSPSYAACDGKSQSPVNIVQKQAVLNKNLKPLTRSYAPVNATLRNHGTAIDVKYETSPGWVTVWGKKYLLAQMHWHSPSEHTIDGQSYPLELHLVHKASDGNITVIGILYKYGDSDPIVEKLEKGLKKLAKEGKKHEEPQIPLGVIDTKQLKRNTRKYYRYAGSLTTPPCSEIVTWNLLGKVRTVSKRQVELLKAPLKREFQKNARPTQPLNGRKIELFKKTDDQ
ncbi:Alpha carbonic anhydrase domain, partial [Dillenia turbinata]